MLSWLETYKDAISVLLSILVAVAAGAWAVYRRLRPRSTTSPESLATLLIIKSKRLIDLAKSESDVYRRIKILQKAIAYIERIVLKYPECDIATKLMEDKETFGVNRKGLIFGLEQAEFSRNASKNLLGNTLLGLIGEFIHGPRKDYYNNIDMDLKYFADTQARLGYVKDALVTSEGIVANYWRDTTKRRIALTQLSAGNFHVALQITNTIGDTYHRCLITLDICEAQIVAQENLEIKKMLTSTLDGLVKSQKTHI